MIKSRRRFLYFLSGVTVAGAASYFLRDLLFPSPKGDGAALPPKAEDQRQQVVEVAVAKLQIPWSMVFAPDGRILLTERVGRIRVVEGGRLTQEPFAEPPVAAAGEGGLLGIALDPRFDNNRFVYTYYTYRDAGMLLNRVVRYVDSGGRGVEPKILVDRIPGGNVHDGGRIKFGPDGKLYITTGEVGRREMAQDLGSLGGKILRVNPDGSIPGDNPFPNSPVFSYGHRNPQGLDWHPESKKLYASEHGPSGEQGFAHDELNMIDAGKNYGWPIVVGKGGDAGFVDPLVNTGSETWAPSGIMFYRGSLFKEWRNNLFVATLRGTHLHRVELDRAGTQVVNEERLFQGTYGRLRDVVEGPDGSIYMLTSNRDGRGNPSESDDRILRLTLR